MGVMGISSPYELAGTSLSAGQIAALKREGQRLDLHDAVDLARSWASDAGIEPAPLDLAEVRSILCDRTS